MQGQTVLHLFVFIRSDISYLFPFALLCVLHSIWQFSIDVAPPLLHAVTWYFRAYYTNLSFRGSWLNAK